MDFKRIIFIGGLLVTSIFIMKQWDTDQTEKAKLAQAQEIANKQTQPVAQIESNDLQSSSIQTSVASSDDDLELVAGVASTAQASAAESSIDSNNLIHVKTDLLDLQINRKHGDFVQLELPTYPVSMDFPDEALVILQNGQREYIARSGIQNTVNNKTVVVNANYTSAQTSYELAEGSDELNVVLSWADADLSIEKTFTFTRGSYAVKVTHKVINNGVSTQNVAMYGQLKRNSFADPTSAGGIGMASFLGFASSTTEDAYQKFDFGDLNDENYQEQSDAGYIAFLQHYFLTAWVPNPSDVNTYYGRKSSKTAGQYSFGYTSPASTLEAGQTAEFSATLYSGPKIIKELDKVDPNLGLTVDYGILWWIAKPLVTLLDWLHSILGNWGFAIIALTIIVKSVLYWPSAKSYRSMAAMKKLMPKMTEIRERYKDDRQKQSMKTMELYKKEGANPMGSCLPMLLQMPIFIALYWVFFESVELRHSPFIFWIDDLSVKDPYFILPVIMGALQFLQMRMGTLPQDPMQRKIMTLMPVLFTFMFMWFASGLVLYWVFNNLFSVLQQWYVNHTIAKEDAAEIASKSKDVKK